MPLNAPNLLTVSRIVMVPLMLVLLFGDQVGALPFAAAVFGVAALTDAADGHVARSRNMITDFGSSPTRSPTSSWSAPRSPRWCGSTACRCGSRS